MRARPIADDGVEMEAGPVVVIGGTFDPDTSGPGGPADAALKAAEARAEAAETVARERTHRVEALEQEVAELTARGEEASDELDAVEARLDAAVRDRDDAHKDLARIRDLARQMIEG